MRATRRTATIAPAAAVLALTGCTSDSAPSSSPSSDSSAPTASPTTEAAAPDPDQAALDRARTLTTELLGQADRRPRVDPGGRFAALHTAHLAALTRASGPSPSTTDTPTRGLPPMVGPRGFRSHEAAAQRELAHLAQEAASGALARLLASMSAGIAAHLAAAGPAR